MSFECLNWMTLTVAIFEWLNKLVGVWSRFGFTNNPPSIEVLEVNQSRVLIHWHNTPHTLPIAEVTSSHDGRVSLHPTKSMLVSVKWRIKQNEYIHNPSAPVSARPSTSATNTVNMAEATSLTWMLLVVFRPGPQVPTWPAFLANSSRIRAHAGFLWIPDHSLLGIGQLKWVELGTYHHQYHISNSTIDETMQRALYS